MSSVRSADGVAQAELSVSKASEILGNTIPHCRGCEYLAKPRSRPPRTIKVLLPDDDLPRLQPITPPAARY